MALMIRWYRLPGPILANSIYNSPKNLTQQGTHESVFCARPAEDVYQVSSWSEMKDYYRPQEVIEAARLMVSVADRFKGNNNFEYDLVDIGPPGTGREGTSDAESCDCRLSCR